MSNTRATPPVDSWWSPLTVEDVFCEQLAERSEESFGGPDVVFDCQVGHSDSTAMGVTISLYDTGHETDDGRKLYDAGVSVDNGDNAPLNAFPAAVAAAIEKFYALGYGQRFALIGMGE